MRTPGVNIIFIASIVLLLACKSKSNKNYNYHQPYYFVKGSFGYDLEFLKNKDSVVLLKSNNGLSQVIVSPKYQGKVFTSTANGKQGKSFGWINYKVFEKAVDPHMNAYGGEDRLWIGPEGGKFALFFKQGSKMEFANWFTPAGIDHQSWTVTGKDDKQVSLTKYMSLVNYMGTKLDMEVKRQISIIELKDIEKALDIQLDTTVRTVAFATCNSIFNAGTKAWTRQTGAPCLWDLDMFTPSPGVTIVIPYREGARGKIATTDYFGQIPPGRVTGKNGHLFFKADGKSRGKLGMSAARSTARAGSYDPVNNVLTITLFDLNRNAVYLNQEWKTDKDPLEGDAVNAYNDGPLADGTQMGPFYEIESVSPGAFLKPGEKLTHRHCVFHFTGDKSKLSLIAMKTLGVSLSEIQSAL